MATNPIHDLNADLPDHLWRPLTQHRPLRGTEPLRIESGEGCYLVDAHGNRLLDGLAGLWCVNVGYGRRELAEVASKQMARLAYLAPIMTAGPAVELADRLQQMLGFDAYVYFATSGSEANETAFKMARQYHLQSGTGGARRYKIISRYRAYHGNTMGAMAATGQAERKTGYDPAPAGFIHVHPPYPYRKHPNLSDEEHAQECARELEETIIHEGAETVAAFIMEPVISGGGVLVPPDSYLPAVREICDRYGVLLILDEVVSGFGRLGSQFGFERWGVIPDIITFAKGMASGYMPIAATVARQHVFERFEGEPGDLKHFRQINTYGGHPVAAAVALENFRILEQENLTQNASQMGDYLRAELAAAIGEHRWTGEIRGLGMLTGVELVADRDTREPLDEATINAILKGCAGRGVILGRNANTIPGRCNVLLIAPPLVVTREDIDLVVGAIAESIANQG